MLQRRAAATKKRDYNYDESKDWGEFCGGNGNGNGDAPASDCHSAGTKAIGAPGYPSVNYKPCCNNSSLRQKKGTEIKTHDDK